MQPAQIHNLLIGLISQRVLQQRFPVGRVVTGKVLQLLGDNKYMVRIAGLKLLVESEASLQTSQRLQLKVLEQQPRLRLQVLKNQQNTLAPAPSKVQKIDPALQLPFDETIILSAQMLSDPSVVRLRVNYFPARRNKQSGPEISTVSLFLDLADIGKTEVLLTHRKNALFIQFMSLAHPWLVHLQQDFSYLAEALKKKLPHTTVRLSIRPYPGNAR